MQLHHAIGILARRTRPGASFFIERQESCRSDGRGNFHFQRDYTLTIRDPDAEAGGRDVLVINRADLAQALRRRCASTETNRGICNLQLQIGN